jgi:hypothetical protein
MTRQEAREFLEKNWWKSLCSDQPQDRLMTIGDLDTEDDYEYGFYAYPGKIGETPPEDLEDWDVWYVSKKGEYCRVNLE